MNVDGVLFISCFLPAILLLHWLIPSERFRNTLLLAAGLIFCAFGSISGVVLLLLVAAVNYLMGRLILAGRGGKLPCAAAVIFDLAFLGFFKYLDFLLSQVLGLPGVQLGIAAPIGISFYIFKCISYIVDTWRDREQGTRRFDTLLLYISFFPQFTAGPIERFSRFQEQLAGRQRLRGFGVGLRDEATWTLRQGHKARVGLDFKYERTWIGGEAPLSTEYRPLPGGSFLTEPVSLERAYDAVFAGLYHEWELGFWGGRLTILPGVRLDLAAINGRVNWAIDPRLSARLRVTEGTTLKASVGHYSRMPSVEYLDEDFGNPELGFAKALQAAVGVEQKIWRTLSADVTVFFNQGYDRLASSDEVMSLGDGTWKATRYVNAGLSRGYGVEVLIRQEMTSRLFGWLAYTLSRSERKGPDDANYRHSSYDQTHILALLAQYRLGRGWSVGARFRLVSGNPTTPVAGSTFDADTGAYEPITGEWYSERAPVFHQLDLRVDKEWTFERWKIGAYLDIQNVYWADNTEYVLWDYRYRGSTGLSGMPFLPSIGVKGSF